MKVKIDVQGLRSLHETALKTGTLEKWSIIALEWAEMAEQEVTELNARIKELGG